MTILICGATGTVGGEVVGQLVAAGRQVRALVRDPAKAQRLGSGVEVVRGDLAQPDTLAAAFSGVRKAFVACSPGPDLATLEGNAYEAAKRAGTEQVVNLSALGVGSDVMAGAPGAEWHGQSEARLRAVGVAWTILRPGPFFSNVTKFWGIKERGGIFLPTGDGKDTHIDPRDIAAVAVEALTTPGHAGKIYELTGPQLLSYAEVVRKVATATGKPLTYVDVPEATWRAEMVSGGFPPFMVDTLLVHFASVKAGRYRLTKTVSELLGRPARTFDEWVRDHLAELR